MADTIGGNLRSPSELSLERLLEASKQIYQHRGVLPLHLATELMERGCIVEELEAAWDRKSGDWVR